MAMNQDTYPFDLPETVYDLEAEKAALGCVISDSDCRAAFFRELPKAEYFYSELHRRIFFAVQKITDTAGAPDIILVRDVLSGEDGMDRDEIWNYLLEICKIVPTMSNFEYYAKILKDKFYLRSLLVMARKTIDNINGGGMDADTVLREAEHRVYDISRGRGVGDLVPINDFWRDVMNDIQRKKSGEEETGLMTGFSALDNCLSGFKPTDLIVLAARPGVGKSAFAGNIALNAAKKGKTVCFFSLEMSKEQIFMRLLAAESGVDMRSIVSASGIRESDAERIGTAAARLGKLDIYIDDTASITMAEIRSRTMRIAASREVDLVIIDYLQLLSSSRRYDNRVNEVSDWTRSAKIMAKDLHVPILLLSQLSRSSEQRKEKRPMLSDLRESGSIEQDADEVIFLFRDETKEEKEGVKKVDDYQIECIVSKNRHGPRDTVYLDWRGKTLLFTQSARPDGKDQVSWNE